MVVKEIDKSDDLEQLAKVIDLIARKHPSGIKSLLGKAPQPSHDDLLAIARPSTGGERVSVKRDIDPDGVSRAAVNNVTTWGILDAVEWPEIVAAVQYYATSPIFQKDWQVYAEYCILWGMPRPHGGGGMIAALCDKYKVTDKTVKRAIKRTPLTIAHIMQRIGSLFSIQIENKEKSTERVWKAPLLNRTSALLEKGGENESISSTLTEQLIDGELLQEQNKRQGQAAVQPTLYTKLSKLTMARFERLRKDAGSVGQIADAIDCNPTIYSMWESGNRRRAIPPRCVRDLAQLLGVDPEDIATKDGKAIFIQPSAQLIP